MIYLRDATNADMSLVLAWHSNPLVYEGFYSTNAPIDWETHYRWWTFTTKDWKKFMVILVEDDIERPIGLVRISPLESWSPEIGFSIGEVSLWGKGYGTKAIELACEWMRKQGYKGVHTTVLETNARALGLLRGLGFEPFGRARKGEWWLQKTL